MFMYMCIYQEPISLFICAGFVPPQEPKGMNPEVPWDTGGTPDLAFIYADHPLISTILQIPPLPPPLFGDLGTAALFGTYHKRFGVITFLHNGKELLLA